MSRMSYAEADKLADVISSLFKTYTDEITEGVKKSVDTVSDEVNTTIKEHITFDQPTKDYVKAFRIKRSASEDRYNKTNIWYVSGKQYRLTHLLEKGHALRRGGRDARAFPHIKYGEEIAQKRMVELTEEVIKNAGR